MSDPSADLGAPDEQPQALEVPIQERLRRIARGLERGICTVEQPDEREIQELHEAADEIDHLQQNTRALDAERVRLLEEVRQLSTPDMAVTQLAEEHRRYREALEQLATLEGRQTWWPKVQDIAHDALAGGTGGTDQSMEARCASGSNANRNPDIREDTVRQARDTPCDASSHSPEETSRVYLPPDGTRDGSGVWRGGKWHPDHPENHAQIVNDPGYKGERHEN